MFLCDYLDSVVGLTIVSCSRYSHVVSKQVFIVQCLPWVLKEWGPFLCKSGVLLRGFNTCILTLLELVALRCVLRTQLFYKNGALLR